MTVKNSKDEKIPIRTPLFGTRGMRHFSPDVLYQFSESNYLKSSEKESDWPEINI